MITGEIVVIRGEGITLDRLVTRKYRRYMRGYVERVMDVNPGLAALGPVLPVGTRLMLPVPNREEQNSSITVVELWK